MARGWGGSCCGHQGGGGGRFLGRGGARGCDGEVGRFSFGWLCVRRGAREEGEGES